MKKRSGVLGAAVMALLTVLPNVSMAEWKVYYTGSAAGMFGSYGRGNFATRGDCDSYRVSRPAFESTNSYCSGFDAPSASKPTGGGQSHKNGAREPEEGQRQNPVAGQRDSDRDEKFLQEKKKLLGDLKMPGSNDSRNMDIKVSPSQFVDPALCEQAKRDRETLRNRLRGLQAHVASLDVTTRMSQGKIQAEKLAKIQAMIGVASSLLDLMAPAIEKGAPKLLGKYRMVQTALTVPAIGTSAGAAETRKSAMDAADKSNDLAKEILLNPRTTEAVRIRVESANRIIAVLNKAIAFELDQRGPKKARDVEGLTKEYVKLANDLLGIFYVPAIPAAVGMKVDESLNAYRAAQDMERRLTLLKASQFNARGYFDGEILNVHAQLEQVERTIAMCSMPK